MPDPTGNDEATGTGPREDALSEVSRRPVPRPRVALTSPELTLVHVLSAGGSVSEAARYLGADLGDTARVIRGLRTKYGTSSTAAAVQAALDDGHRAQPG